MTEPVLEVRDLRVRQVTYLGDVDVLNGVDFAVRRGETVGLVGETGSGKSVLIMAIVRLLSHGATVVGGDAMFSGRSMFELSEDDLLQLRGNQISLIMQNARSALDPLAKVGKQIGTIYQIHTGAGTEEAREKSLEMIRRVQLADPERVAEARVDELSGGMAQRIAIAMALICGPKLLLADNPTSGLDVTVQAQVLDLLSGLARNAGLSTLLATTDLGVVAHYCDHVAVLYEGEIVEFADVATFFQDARHPYSLRLIGAASYQHVARSLAPTHNDRGNLGGEACGFRLKCPLARERCFAQRPALETVGEAHRARCHYWRTSRAEVIDGVN
jgi:peptide/nickel transport system ATP-binding protein